MKVVKWCMLLIFGLVISGCGGGGNNAPTPNPPPTSGSSIVTGVAAVGAPIVGQVWLKDAFGTLRGPVSTGDGGNFTIDVSGLQPPYFLEAVGTASNNSVRMRGIGFATGIVNINPFSELAIFAATGIDPAQVFLSRVEVDSVALKEAVLQALDSIRQMIALLLNESNLSLGNPCSEPFVADGTGLDGLLDMIALELNSLNNSVQLRERVNNQIVASAEVLSGTPRLINITEMPVSAAQNLVNHFRSKGSGTGNFPELTGISPYPFNLMEVNEAEDFDNDGQIDWVFSIDFAYDSNGRLSQRTINEGPAGKTVSRTETWNYDSSGRLAEIADNVNGSMTFSYALDKLLAVNGGQNLWTLTADSEGRLGTIIRTWIGNFSKDKEEFVYNSLGLVTETHFSMGQMNQATYSQSDKYISSYDNSGRWLKTEEYRAPFVNDAHQVWTGSYDPSGRLEKVVCIYDDDEDGVKEGRVIITLTYDSKGSLSQSTYADDWDSDGVADSTSVTIFTFRDGGMPSAGFGTGMPPYNQKAPLVGLILEHWMGLEL